MEEGQEAVFIRVVRKDVPERVLFEQRLGGGDGVSHENIWGGGGWGVGAGAQGPGLLV